MWRGALVLVVAACHGEPAPVVQPPRAASELTWTIDVSPSRLTIAAQATATVRITATNHGRAAIQPPRSLDFTVDGTFSMDATTAFNNGGLDPAWLSLPPGATARDERVGLELASTPGDHVLTVLDRQHGELARASFHLDP